MANGIFDDLSVKENLSVIKKSKLDGDTTVKGNLTVGDSQSNLPPSILSITGQVGIGTDKPTAGLEIDKGETNELGLLLKSTGNGLGSGLQLKNSKCYGIYSKPEGSLHFADVDIDVDRLLIDKEGQVFISGNLTVEGTQTITKGNLTVEGNVGIGTPGAGPYRLIVAGGDTRLAAVGQEQALFGLDKLVGLNDLRFYIDDKGTTEVMHLGANGLTVNGAGGASVDLTVKGCLRSDNDDGGLWVSSNRFVGGHSSNKIGFYNGDAWRLTVQEDGNVGIGTTTDIKRTLHVEGHEIHSGGSSAGFSFSNRQTNDFIETPNKGERWVWYATEGDACLWSGSNRFKVTKDGDLHINNGRTLYSPGRMHIYGEENLILLNKNGVSVSKAWQGNGNLTVEGNLTVSGKLNKLDVDSTDVIAYIRAHDLLFGHPTRRGAPGRALADEKNYLTINHGNDWDHVRFGSKVKQPSWMSSCRHKENIAPMSIGTAASIIKSLEAVSFNWRDPLQSRKAFGFIAEDAPEEVTSEDRASIFSMHILAALVRLVNDQQDALDELRELLRGTQPA